TVVKAGQVVKVKVLEIDLQRQRIALSMRMGDEPTQGKRHDNAPAGRSSPNQQRAQQRGGGPAPAGGNAMASAFARLKR
ncbi:MAG TPA: S1 RNA-binding domain-containing protein, partial [Azonexus sp.]|nr:S1 RNA-binding domain-containing protein [Azonexus sp.]